jgi:glucuronate isomerase
MKEFLGDDFLLETETANTLFHKYANNMPIFDYHCHLIPKEIAENVRFKSITEAWLGGDHYKWRQMRTHGIDESLITGDGNDWDKFYAWASTIEKLIGNPLYHWTHLELRRYFGITDILNRKNAKKIYDEANEKLKTDPNLTVYGIMKKFKVYALGTTDDPTDDLKYHIQIREEGKCPAKVLPSFRPDKFTSIDKPTFVPYLNKLEKVCNRKIASANDIVEALDDRLKFFIENGCRITDHGIDTAPPSIFATETEADNILQKRLDEIDLTDEEVEKWMGYLLLRLGRLYNKYGISMQIHMNVLRNTNTEIFEKLGPDVGCDACNDIEVAKGTSIFLNELNKTDELPKTVLYSLNQKDYYSLGTIMGSFQKAPENKIQLGSGWWFCDHIDGMQIQMKTLANLGQLPYFVGMLTDSRSFLSYPRHEYFRRIMCDLIGSMVENGEVPYDIENLGQIVEDISFNNAKTFFKV